MIAHALLAVIAATERARRGRPEGLIALTCNEIRRLLALLTISAHTITNALAWSRWRRQHQQRAKISHYQRRDTQPSSR